ncbi:OXA-55 family carbapenem-hydrolyzing class D beta-lactamase [Shewanella indica]|uniref:Beta-lactamase n=1 Tax=Shewanella indica TaxID=768528 RepID=A0ABU4QEM5_9GAMM|nr:OXA-55 family carbapenem-hydrolyzing class D beta-lactamase [Shewanella indica]MDX6016744.1 OXA-55 family carbapenem-hydrolyzing class D beta-lactamase [Shewanella indica]
MNKGLHRKRLSKHLLLPMLLCLLAQQTQVVAAAQTKVSDVGSEVTAEGWQEVRRWDKLFESAGVKGCLLLWDQKRSLGLSNNLSRAAEGFIPASTFKIPSSLIALQTGAVRDETSRFSWDGKVREIAAWNRDQSFRTAMKYSVVPVYQQLAREIGPKVMAAMVRQLQYGNQDIGGQADSFWLDGQLRITAFQQLDFLQQLHDNKLPVSERSQRIVKQMMLTEASTDYIIRAKTGYGVRHTPAIGWWVGWLELDDNTVYFAINLDLASAGQLPLRQQLVKQVLKQEQLLP